MAKRRTVPAGSLALALAASMLTAFAPADQAQDRANERASFNRTQQEVPADPRVTIAVIDGATNPYHDFFHEGSEIYPDAPSAVTQDVLDEFDIGEDHIIELTPDGTFEDRFAADREKFEAIERGQPYWFKGTNVIGISFGDTEEDLFRPDDESASAHGVGTTASALRANPEAIVISVEGLSVSGSDALEEAEDWSFTHPAIDLVSTSYGTPAGEPDVLGGFGNLTASYEGVVERGKHHFGAVANAPTPAPIDPTGGPWWSIGVSGYEEGDSEGRQMLSGSYADFVGDFTQDLPYCRACTEGEQSVGGTSFATPTAAGVFSSVLLQARRAAGHEGGIVTEGVEQPLMVQGEDLELTNWQLRRALEDSAVYPQASDWDPTADAPWGLTSTPAFDPAPYLTFGWGVITADPEDDVVGETLAHAGVEGDTSRDNAEACSYMTLNVQLRQTYWNNLEPGSDSAGTDEDPYEYC